MMVEKMLETSCDIVVASPYMKGGKVIAVPFGRKMMSKWVNLVYENCSPGRILHLYRDGEGIQGRIY
jgi:hypothetical protein